MSRCRTLLVGALAVPLLAACGSVSSAAAGLERDAEAADAALANARGVGVALRFDDPDGELARALADGNDGLPPALADIVAGSRIELRVAATDGRRLAELPGADVALPEQLRWYDSAVTVSTGAADLLSYRTVDGDVYVSSDLDEVERVAAAAGEPLSLADEVAGAPEGLRAAHDAVRAGEWLHLPTSALLEQLGGLAGETEQPFAGGLPEGLVDDLRAAVQPHAQLTDLGSDDGVRRVTVEVAVKDLIESVVRTVQDGMSEDEAFAEELPADLLGGLTDASLTGTLTLEDGHYRSLEVPLAGLVDLVDDPTADVPDLGKSSLVVEIDDAVEEVPVPSRISDVDLMSVFGDAFAGPAEGELTAPEGLTPEDEALIACYEQAETEADFVACEATA